MTFVCLCDGEKGYSDYRYDHVAFSGFRYYHSIEYTKLDWLKASGYGNFKIQTLGLPRIYFLVRKETSAVSIVSQRSTKNKLEVSFISQIQLFRGDGILSLRGHDGKENNFL